MRPPLVLGGQGRRASDATGDLAAWLSIVAIGVALVALAALAG
jgi:hypothetical protein